jgi:hypothetical protein
MAAAAAKRCTEEGVNQWASRRLVRFAQQTLMNLLNLSLMMNLFLMNLAA